MAEGHERERDRRDDVEAAVGGDPVGEFAGEPHVLPDVVLDPLGAAGPEDPSVAGIRCPRMVGLVDVTYVYGLRRGMR